MSLLADLLSKVKATGGRRDVPPDLREAVAAFARKTALRKRIIVLSLAALLAVGSGFGAVYLLDRYVKPPGKPPGKPEDRQKTAMRSTAAVPSPTAPPAPLTSTPQPERSAKPEPAADEKRPAGERPSSRKPLTKQQKKTGIPARHTARKQTPHQEGGTISPEEKPAPASPVPPAPAAVSAPASAPARQQLSREELAEKDLYLYSARTFEARREYQQALTSYKKALEIDPESYLVMNNIAGVLIQTGSYEESLHYSRRALVARQNYVPSLVNLGVALLRLGSLAEGEGYLSKALSLEPSNRFALLNLALLHEKAKEYDKASRSFTQLLETGDLQGYLGMARIAEKKGQRAEALRLYREILSLNDLDTKTRKMINERLQALGDGS